MISKNANKKLFNILQQSLKVSTGRDKQLWAKQIVDENIDLMELSAFFLHQDRATAMRFSWMLSDIGLYNATSLFNILPYLFEKREQTSIENFSYSFVKYWRIAGVPKENIGVATNLLFNWLMAPETSVSVKTHSMEVLYSLTREYPELKNELIVCIEDQLDKTKVSFRTKAIKILKGLKKVKAD